jgi:hypothetical protein
MKTETRQILEQGLVAGVLGHLTVAIVFALANLAGGRSLLYTPALLGASFFYGLTDPAQLEIRAAYVFAYNGTHLLVFLAFGMIGAWLAAIADRGWQLWYLSAFFFMFVTFHIFGFIQLAALPLGASFSDATLWGAGLAATLVMAAYFLSRHAPMRAQLAHWQEQ